MIEIQKKHVQSILLTISAYDPATQKPVSGLLFENIGLGLKRKLQKIHKELIIHHNELIEDLKEAKEKGEEEVKVLLEESIKLTSDKALLSEIEKIHSDKNYDFELLEMIAE
jgi:hypothetical protein